MGGRGAELAVAAVGSTFCSYTYFRFLTQGRWCPDEDEHQVYTFLQRVTEAELAGVGDAWEEMACSKIKNNYIKARGNEELEVVTCTGGRGAVDTWLARGADEAGAYWSRGANPVGY
jgi:hypothetical protein